MNPSSPFDNDDDRHWLDLMGGHSAPDAHAATRQEAAWMRAALLAYRIEAPAGGPSRPDLRVQRLLQRARAAGVLQSVPPRDPAWQRSRRWLLGDGKPLRLGAVVAAMVAALVLAVVGLPLWLPTAEPDPAGIERGASLQTLQVADPRAARETMQAALRQAGMVAAPYERLGRPGLDIELPATLSAEQRQALRQLKLAQPAGLVLRVEFVPTRGQP